MNLTQIFRNICCRSLSTAHYCLLLLALLALMNHPLSAQTAGAGNINGAVTDTSQAAVAGASDYGDE